MLENLPEYVKLKNAYNPAHYPANKKIPAEEWNALWLATMYQGNHQEDVLASILNNHLPEIISNTNSLLTLTDIHSANIISLQTQITNNDTDISQLQTDVDIANNNANDAVSTANTANTNSETAVSTANEAKSIAENAESVALGIDAKATDALSNSEEALSTINGVVDEVDAKLLAKADLVDGKVPNSQLPSYVDDVLECYIVGSTPLASDWLSLTVGGTALTPESGKIYVILTSGTYEGQTYRWGGTVYVMISASLVLGETSATAYRGDRGKTAYDHSQIVTGNPHGTTADDISDTDTTNKFITAEELAQIATNTNNINALETDKADKATTISGYGIADAYTKTEIDNKVASVYKYRGSVADYSSLPTENLTVGDVYNVEDTGDNYAWTGTEWDDIGGTVDLSNYLDKATQQTITGLKNFNYDTAKFSVSSENTDYRVPLTSPYTTVTDKRFLLGVPSSQSRYTNYNTNVYMENNKLYSDGKEVAEKEYVDTLRTFCENTETFNFYEEKEFNHGQRAYNYFYFDRIHFLCSKSCLTKLKITVRLKLNSLTGSTYTSKIYVMLNSTSTATNRIFDASQGYNSTDIPYTYTFEHKFYPTKENNFISIRIVSGTTNQDNANVKIESISIEGTGRNFIFLNKPREFKVYISQNYYYITKNTPTGGEYLKTPTSAVNLSSAFTSIPDLIPSGVSTYTNKYFPYNYCFIPKINYNTVTEKYEIDDTIDYFLFCSKPGNSYFQVLAGKTNPESGVESLLRVSSLGFAYIPAHPGESGTYPNYIMATYTANTYTCPIYVSTTTSEGVLTNTSISLTDIPVADYWVSNTPVFGKDWENNPNIPHMMIGTTDLGLNYFFSAPTDNYKIALGKGYNVNAYLQSDGSINVYMRWLNKVYKKILTYNSTTEQYELSSNVTEFDNTIEIIEGYSTDYFICDVNGNWSYVPVS